MTSRHARVPLPLSANQGHRLASLHDKRDRGLLFQISLVESKRFYLCNDIGMLRDFKKSARDYFPQKFKTMIRLE